MTDYTKSTDFAAKDDLPSGNANKVVSGTEINTEFANIETAVNSKANTSSPTFTGTVTIPTIDANAGNIDGTAIGASSASTGAFTTITGTTITASTGFVGNVTGNITGTAPAGTLTGATLASNVLASSLTSLGTIASLVATTADINGGTIDGTTIGGTTPAAGTFTTLIGTTIDGVIGSITPAAGTFTTFTSTGIDDNATEEVLELADGLITLGKTAAAAQAIVATPQNDGLLWLNGGTAGNSGANLLMYGGTHASRAYDFEHRRDSTVVLSYDDSGDIIYIPLDDFVVGSTTAGAASAATLYATGAGKFSTGSSGATANSAGDDLVIEGSGNTGLSIMSPDASLCSIYFGNPSGAQSGIVSWDRASSAMSLGTNQFGSSLVLRAGSYAEQVTFSGNSGSESAVFAGTVTATDGIYLGGTGSANLLDDYEEGTFTLTTNSDATGAFTSETGDYTKVGNKVFVGMAFDVSTTFTSTFIGGMPFTANFDGGVSGIRPFVAMSKNETGMSGSLICPIIDGGTLIRFYEGGTDNQHLPNTTQDIYRIEGAYSV